MKVPQALQIGQKASAKIWSKMSYKISAKTPGTSNRPYSVTQKLNTKKNYTKHELKPHAYFTAWKTCNITFLDSLPNASNPKKNSINAALPSPPLAASPIPITFVGARWIRFWLWFRGVRIRRTRTAGLVWFWFWSWFRFWVWSRFLLLHDEPRHVLQELTQVFGYTTETNGCEEVDGEPRVLGVIPWKDGFEGILHCGICEPLIQ